MTYITIRNSLNGCSPHVPRDAVIAAITAYADSPIKIMFSGMDDSVSKGLYLAPTNRDHEFVNLFGRHVIVVRRDMNRCWTRFVLVKELMHILDASSELTDSNEKFYMQLTEFSGPLAVTSQPHQVSEVKAAWMALGLLCPDVMLSSIKEKLERGHLTEYGAALQLRIPQIYIPRLVSPQFLEIMNFLSENNA